jgi:hypothetical protein
MKNIGARAEQVEGTNRARFDCIDLPRRTGRRPTTLCGPLHIQCAGHGDPKYLDQLVSDVLSWPHIEALPASADRPDTVPIRIEQGVAANESASFLSAREFARVMRGAPTIYLGLPLIWAHWAIVRGWAEPHYLGSFGLLPAGTVVVYTPRDLAELSVCYSLFSAAYDSAYKFSPNEAGGRLAFGSVARVA